MAVDKLKEKLMELNLNTIERNKELQMGLLQHMVFGMI